MGLLLLTCVFLSSCLRLSEKNIYVCVHCQPKAREIFAVNLASPEKYMVPRRFLFLLYAFHVQVSTEVRRGGGQISYS